MSQCDVIIAIDGPAGAGKSTVGKAVARRLGLEYLDTGAMYRAVAFAALRRGIPVTDDDAVAELARGSSTCRVDEDGVIVDGVDATAEIRGREVTEAVSASPPTRRSATSCAPRQREWADERGGGVIEGRDIGIGRVPRRHAEAVRHGVAAGPRRAAGRRDRRRRRRGRGVDRRARPAGHDARRRPAAGRRRCRRRRHDRPDRSTRSSTGSSSCCPSGVADDEGRDVPRRPGPRPAASPTAIARVVRRRVHPAVDADRDRGPRAHPDDRRVRAGAGAPLEHGHADRRRA